MIDSLSNYQFQNELFDQCSETLKSWFGRHQTEINFLETTRCPETEPDEIAFLWVFAEFEFGNSTGDKVRGKVVVVPAAFLESEPESELEGAFEMVFSTFGCDEPGANFFPFLFTDRKPVRFIKYLKEKKGIEAGPGGLTIVTPEGVV